jgi:3-hydroxybutyryl-CoA dehydrogenase
MGTRKVFVVGFGMMGNGIAQVSAQAGYEVVAQDIDEDILERGMKTIAWSVEKLASKGKIEGTKEEVLGRIRTTTDLNLAEEADLVVEAVIEDLELKQRLFSDLDRRCSPKTILASNTSALLITDIASKTNHPERVVGTHFFNPAPIMRLVEVVKGLLTSDETMVVAKDYVLSLGKEPLLVHKDIPGFVVNRINGWIYLEAMRLLEQGVASAEDIDKGMRLGVGHSMGPFETMDMAGLDTILNARMAVYNGTRDQRLFPPDILRRMVSAGLLGRKTGRGFYAYAKEKD